MRLAILFAIMKRTMGNKILLTIKIRCATVTSYFLLQIYQLI